MQIKKILFPTDFSESAERALDHALVLAHRFDAELLMLHVESPHDADPNNPQRQFPELEELFSFIKSQVSSSLDKDDLPVMDGDITLREKVVRGYSVSHEILALAQDEAVDLIVIGTKGRTGLGHFLLGSTAEKVVHGAAMPVMTIHHGEDLLIANGGSYKRILVATDFSDASRGALRATGELARLFGSEVVVSHVVEPVYSSPALFAGTSNPLELDRETTARTHQAMHDFAGDLLPEGYELDLRSGVVHKTVLEAVEETGSDLLVIADHGWNAVERWLLGGSAEKLIRRSPVPVLTIRD